VKQNFRDLNSYKTLVFMIPVKTVWIFKDKKSSKKTAPNTRAQNPPKNNKTTKTSAKVNFKHKQCHANKNKHQPNNNYSTLQTTTTTITSSTSANQPKQEQTQYV
jgi:hypothetical protein